MDTKYRKTLTDLLEAVNNKIDFTTRAFPENAGKRELLSLAFTYKKRLVATLAESKIDYNQLVSMVLMIGIYNGTSEILMSRLPTRWEEKK